MYTPVLPVNLVRVPSLRGLIASLAVRNSPVSVSSAGTTNIAASTTKPFLHCFQRINVAAGSYTRNFALLATNALTDSIIEIDFNIAASSDATLILPIYSLTVSGSPIEQLRGRAEASYYNLRVIWNGTAWEKLTGAYQ